MSALEKESPMHRELVCKVVEAVQKYCVEVFGVCSENVETLSIVSKRSFILVTVRIKYPNGRFQTFFVQCDKDAKNVKYRK